MNRFEFLKTVFEGSQEMAYVLDTETGTVIKSPVMYAGDLTPKREMATEHKPLFTAPSAVDQRPPVRVVVQEIKDPAGDLETPEERALRLKGPKVPPAFLGDIRKMHLDPGKTDGKTDVTPSR